MLTDLESRLRNLSHSEEALAVIKAFSEDLENSKRRLEVFNADRGLVQSPIYSQVTKCLGFTDSEDDFTLLQGDIITTESAFFLGERVTGHPKYVVLNSSCDLIPNRREHAALLRIQEIRDSDKDFKSKLSYLLRFKKTDSMYLPALPSDSQDIVCNAILFDGICQIRCSDLLLANRLASLSLVAWRIFGSFARTVIARANPRECEIRMAVERKATAA